MSHLPPGTTPAPTPASIFTTTSSPSDMSPAVPSRPAPTSVPAPDANGEPRSGSKPQDDQTPRNPGHGSAFELPKLRLEVRDLAHPGAAVLLDAVRIHDCLAAAARNVLALLYDRPACPTTTVPTTRSVTLVLRDMPGVAYTTGYDLDDDHKEIHFSLAYVAGIKPPSRRGHEITGVLTHELVHCLQYNGFGACSGGLIEGVADWVRLHCGLAPPHWERGAGGNWDAGYQHTAYFLDYLEDRFGAGTIRRLNEKLRIQRYEEKPFWTELVGRPVEQLWGDYQDKLRDEDTVVVNKDDAVEK